MRTGARQDAARGDERAVSDASELDKGLQYISDLRPEERQLCERQMFHISDTWHLIFTPSIPDFLKTSQDDNGLQKECHALKILAI